MKTSTHHDEPLTLFGRPWRAASLMVPFLAWVTVAAVALALAIARETGAIAMTGPVWSWSDAHTFWAVAIGAVLLSTAAGFLYGLRAHHTGLVRAWCTMTPLMGGVWTLYAVGSGLRAWMPWIAWAFAFGLNALLYVSCRQDQFNYEADHLSGTAAVIAEEERAAAARATAVAAVPPPPPAKTAFELEAERWEELFAVCGATGLEFFRRTPNKAGFTLHMGLPDDGSVSFDAVRSISTRIEQVFGKRLLKDFPRGSRPGCVRVQRASNSDDEQITGEIYVHVDVRDILRKTIRIPDEFTPISIYEAFQVGEFADGKPCSLTLAEIHMLIVGRTRMGKSNLLNLLTRQVARCYDAVIWAYDGKGGRFLRPWLKPYLAKEKDPHTGQPLDRPIFDWASIDLTEFERQVDAAIEIAASRALLLTAAGSGHTATADDPAIFFLADELSEAAGVVGAGAAVFDTLVNVKTSELQGKLARLVRLGAGEGVYFCGAQQRGTVTSGMSGDGKAQLGGRILLPVKAGEAGDVLADADAETIRLCTTLKHPGTVVVEGFGHEDSMPAKLWLMGERHEIEAEVRRQVLELTWRRPKLHPSVAAMIDKFGYAARWTHRARTAWMHHRKPDGPGTIEGHLLRWNAPAMPGTTPTPAAAESRLARTRVEALGLVGVPNPFAQAPAQRTSAHAEADTTAPALISDDEVARRWQDVDAQLAAEIGYEPTNPAVQPAPAAPVYTLTAPVLQRVAATFENAAPYIVRIVDAAPNGISIAETARQLGETYGIRPKSRGTIKDWMDKLADQSRQLVRATNDSGTPLFFTARNLPQP